MKKVHFHTAQISLGLVRYLSYQSMCKISKSLTAPFCQGRPKQEPQFRKPHKKLWPFKDLQNRFVYIFFIYTYFNLILIHNTHLSMLLIKTNKKHPISMLYDTLRMRFVKQNSYSELLCDTQQQGCSRAILLHSATQDITRKPVAHEY